jgi:hypothetical protein
VARFGLSSRVGVPTTVGAQRHKQHRLMKYSFGSAMLKAVLSKVTTVLIPESMVPTPISTLRKKQLED